MIDSTKSPMPAWRRYASVVALTVLVAIAGFVIWTKELHHNASATASVSPPAVAKTATTKPAAATTTTTIPGGLPVSSRNPFG